MKRRQFIHASIGGGIILASTGVWLSIEANEAPLTIESALHKLELFAEKNLLSSGEWTPSQIFSHCAQSINYSMSGFPKHKSEVFKTTLGQLAFSAFSAKGKMTHSLSEPIPGAPLISPELNTNAGLVELKNSLIQFQEFKGDLAPHFAYGELSKQDYEIAHVMHLYNHFQEIDYLS